MRPKSTAAQRLTDLANEHFPGAKVELRPRSEVWARGWFLYHPSGGSRFIGENEEKAALEIGLRGPYRSDTWEPVVGSAHPAQEEDL
jgi:hypothetical protein